MVVNVQLENFGPVKRGQFNLKNVTVFLGPPNTGKSYTAKAIYAIAESFVYAVRELGRHREFIEDVARGIEDVVKGLSIPSIEELGERSTYSIISSPISIRVLGNVIIELLEHGIEKAFTRTFYSYGKQLLEKAFISISSEELKLHLDHGKVIIDNLERIQVPAKIELDVVGPNDEMILKYSCGALACRAFLPPPSFFVEKSERRRMFKEFFVERVTYAIIALTFYELMRKTFETDIVTFIPYGRETYSVILGLVRRRPMRTILSSSFRGMLCLLPLPIRMYLREFDTEVSYWVEEGIVQRMKRFDPNLALLIKAILRGDVRVDENRKIVYSDERSGIKLELFNSSAMVGGMTGLLLPLARVSRYKANCLTIVEEPESQLHPRYQRLIAWILALFASSRTRIVITTHSDFLITELAIIDKLKTIDIEKAVEITRSLLDVAELKEVLSDETVKDIVEKVRSVDVAFYFFDEDGEPREVSTNEILISIPSMVEQVSKQLNALRELV